LSSRGLVSDGGIVINMTLKDCVGKKCIRDISVSKDRKLGLAKYVG